MRNAALALIAAGIAVSLIALAEVLGRVAGW